MKKTIALTALLSAISLYSVSSHASGLMKAESPYVTSSYAQTKYPIVFAHGMSGFSRIGNSAFGLDYWYQILPDLARNGATAYATQVSPFNSTEVRGEQLLQQVDEIIAITGQPKVNLIGHSHGGPTARYVAGINPNKIASLTAIASPQKGAPLADLILKVENTPLEFPIITALNLLSRGIVFAQGLDQNAFPVDVLASGKSVSVASAPAFNAKFPMGVSSSACGEGAYQENGIYLYSFLGNKTLTNIIDPDSVTAVVGLVINGANDGLVSTCSAKFGKTVRDNYAWNHFDEVNQVLGLRGFLSQDPVQVYREHANRLKTQGL